LSSPIQPPASAAAFDLNRTSSETSTSCLALIVLSPQRDWSVCLFSSSSSS
jgi:hypothetical protein